MSMFLTDSQERELFARALHDAASGRNHEASTRPVGRLSLRLIALLERATYLHEDWDLVGTDKQGRRYGHIQIRQQALYPLLLAQEGAGAQLNRGGSAAGGDADRVSATLSYLRAMSRAPLLSTEKPGNVGSVTQLCSGAPVTPQEIYIAERRSRAREAAEQRRVWLRGIGEHVNCAIIDPDRYGAGSVLWADDAVRMRSETHHSWAEFFERLWGGYRVQMKSELGGATRGLVVRDGLFAVGICPVASYMGLLVGSSAELGRIASVVRQATEGFRAPKAEHTSRNKDLVGSNA